MDLKYSEGKRKISVLVISHTNKKAKPRHEFFIEELANSQRLRVKSIDFFEVSSYISVLLGLRHLFRAGRFQPDVIIGISHWGGFIGGLLAKLLNRPLIVMLDDFLIGYPGFRAKRWAIYLLERFAVSDSELTIFATEIDRRTMSPIYSLNPKKTAVLTHGVGKQLAQARKERMKSDLDKSQKTRTRVGYIGTLDDSDRQFEELCEVIPLLADHLVQLVIAGDGKWKNKFEKLQQKYGTDFVEVLGFIADRKKLTKVVLSLDFQIVPYKSRPYKFRGKTMIYLPGLTLKVIESLALGVPLILPNYKDYQEQYGEISAFYQSCNVISLRDTLVKCTGNEFVRLSERIKGSKIANNIQTWEEKAIILTNLIEKTQKAHILERSQ
ncbi:MAG: glycosyltransferase [Candidatus Heimdallarchaeota archaeon]